VQDLFVQRRDVLRRAVQAIGDAQLAQSSMSSAMTTTILDARLEHALSTQTTTPTFFVGHDSAILQSMLDDDTLENPNQVLQLIDSIVNRTINVSPIVATTGIASPISEEAPSAQPVPPMMVQEPESVAVVGPNVITVHLLDECERGLDFSTSVSVTQRDALVELCREECLGGGAQRVISDCIDETVLKNIPQDVVAQSRLLAPNIERLKALHRQLIDADNKLTQLTQDAMKTTVLTNDALQTQLQEAKHVFDTLSNHLHDAKAIYAIDYQIALDSLWLDFNGPDPSDSPEGEVKVDLPLFCTIDNRQRLLHFTEAEREAQLYNDCGRLAKRVDGAFVWQQKQTQYRPRFSSGEKFVLEQLAQHVLDASTDLTTTRRAAVEAFDNWQNRAAQFERNKTDDPVWNDRLRVSELPRLQALEKAFEDSKKDYLQAQFELLQAQTNLDLHLLMPSVAVASQRRLYCESLLFDKSLPHFAWFSRSQNMLLDECANRLCSKMNACNTDMYFQFLLLANAEQLDAALDQSALRTAIVQLQIARAQVVDVSSLDELRHKLQYGLQLPTTQLAMDKLVEEVRHERLSVQQKIDEFMKHIYTAEDNMNTALAALHPKLNLSAEFKQALGYQRARLNNAFVPRELVSKMIACLKNHLPDDTHDAKAVEACWVGDEARADALWAGGGSSVVVEDRTKLREGAIKLQQTLEALETAYSSTIVSFIEIADAWIERREPPDDVDFLTLRDPQTLVLWNEFIELADDALKNKFI